MVAMSCEKMAVYIEFVADRLLIELGCPTVYRSSNPFPFMELICQQGKTNFFEKRVGDYQKASVAVIETPQLSTMDITEKDF
ncbi:hypothetical protein QTP88_029772 [Uroleucon formosanum]